MPGTKAILRSSAAIGSSALLAWVGISYRELSDVIWRFFFDLLSGFPEWLAAPLLAFALLYIGNWFYDRWFQRLQYLFALNLVAVMPGIPLELSRLLLLGLFVPLIGWLLMVPERQRVLLMHAERLAMAASEQLKLTSDREAVLRYYEQTQEIATNGAYRRGMRDDQGWLGGRV